MTGYTGNLVHSCLSVALWVFVLDENMHAYILVPYTYLSATGR
jgi:hypothetical protein